MGSLDCRLLGADLSVDAGGGDDSGFFGPVGCEIYEYKDGRFSLRKCSVDGDGFLCYINEEGREVYFRNGKGECVVADLRVLKW